LLYIDYMENRVVKYQYLESKIDYSIYSKIKDMINMGIKSKIAMYYILDSEKSSKFKITFSEAVNSWVKEIKIFKAIYNNALKTLKNNLDISLYFTSHVLFYMKFGYYDTESKAEKQESKKHLLCSWIL
jgi:hypothetical protein